MKGAEKRMNLEITKHNIFIENMWSFKMPNHVEWKKQIEQIVLVEKNKDKHNFSTQITEECRVKGFRTAWDSHHRYDSLNKIISVIKNNFIQEIIKTEEYDCPNLRTDQCWINWYEKNNYAELHNHPFTLGCTYFVKTEDTSSKFVFHREQNFSLVKKNEDNNTRYLEAEEGTVIIFNGKLLHSVTPNTSDKTRITISANFNPIYNEERKEY
jgi:uncharacterized protein (TIGR02466 family)